MPLRCEYRGVNGTPEHEWYEPSEDDEPRDWNGRTADEHEAQKYEDWVHDQAEKVGADEKKVDPFEGDLTNLCVHFMWEGQEKKGTVYRCPADSRRVKVSVPQDGHEDWVTWVNRSEVFKIVHERAKLRGTAVDGDENPDEEDDEEEEAKAKKPKLGDDGACTTKVKVFHAAFEPKEVHIATVEAPHDDPLQACEYAFRWTQNIEDSWSKKMPKDGNEAVTVEVPVEEYGHRSSCVGDFFEVEGQLYKCAGIGFEPADKMECRFPNLVRGSPPQTDDDDPQVIRGADGAVCYPDGSMWSPQTGCL